MKRVFATFAGGGLAALAPKASSAAVREQINLKIIYKAACRWFAYNQYRNKFILAAGALILSGYTMTIIAVSMSIKL